MESLASRLGISRATLYRRVGNREALVARLIDERSLPRSVAEPSADALRRRMLEAVRALLGSEGVRGVTLERVAQEAGVGSATVYRHFGDRAGLVRAFAAEFSPRQALGQIEAAPSGDLRADLVTLATQLIRFVRDNHDLVRLRFSADPESEAFFEAARSTPERLSFGLRRYFRVQVDEGRLAGQDPDLLAMSFMGLLLGCALARPLGWEALEPDEGDAALYLVDLFLDGAFRKHATEVGER
jgi:AcrR family transcriptional regulator